MTRVVRWPAALILAVAAIGMARFAAAEVQVHTVEHRPAEELLPLVESALGEGARAGVDPATNSIVVTGSAESIRAVGLLLERLDVARRQVLVTVESRSSRALRGADYRVEWADAGDRMRVGRLVAEGSRARHPSAAGGAGFVVSSAGEEAFSTSLRILDGDVGMIEIGRSTTITDRRIFGTTTAIVEVKTGLLAAPRVFADGRIELQLTPYEGDVSREADTRTMGAETTVVLQSGEVVVVAGLGRRGAGAGQDAFAWRSASEAGEEVLLLVSASVLRAEMDGPGSESDR